MNTRTFLIPMQSPANGTGKGTRADPWRPRHLQELGLSFSIHNARHFCIAEVTGPNLVLDELAAKPDVVELRNDGKLLSDEEHARACRMLDFAGVRHAREPVDRRVIQKLKAAVLLHQRTTKPSASLHKSVMDGSAARGH
jgi:hypothetical protein